MITKYSKFIKEQREERGYAQAEVADRMGISRSSYIAIEKGTKELSLSEADALARLFGVTISELLQNQAPDPEKYKQMVLAYLRAAKASRKQIKKTKLAKLLYLADFAWYYEHLHSMSGMSYRRIEFGPVPNEYFSVLEELENDGSIDITQQMRDDDSPMYEIEETPGSERTDLHLLSKEEMRLIGNVWRKWKDARTEKIVKFTHEQVPYKFSFDAEIIPYELITQEDPDHVY